MADRLDATVALVTGASSGIGEASARALASAGATVAVAARRKDRLDALVRDIENGGGRALAIETDVTDQAQANAAVARTVQELGRLTGVSTPIIDAVLALVQERGRAAGLYAPLGGAR